MKRRTFLGLALASGAGLSGALWLKQDVHHPELDLDIALQKLKQLINQDVISSADWTPAQIFNHCAQSIEFSMTGFPVHKSDVFKQTAGKIALSVFTRNGSMTHGLAEPIPGAPDLIEKSDTQLALKRLMQSLLDFQGVTVELKPHFAYGVLNKAEYAKAHVLHLNNHLEQISIT